MHRNGCTAPEGNDMKFLKIALVFLCLLSTAWYSVSAVRQKKSGKTEGPSIVCESPTVETSVSAGETALRTGVTASDPQDGDLTDQIIVARVSKLISKDTATVTYLVFDRDNNMATATRTVHYTDYQRPRFRLDQPLVFTVGQPISLTSRLHATDSIDGDVSDSIRISALNIVSSTAGVYYITAQVTNSMGDTAQIKLPVILNDEAAARPVIQLTEGLVYLKTGDSFRPADYLKSVSVGDRTESTAGVTWESNVDTAQAGSYFVTYTVSSGGVTGTAMLSVIVE